LYSALAGTCKYSIRKIGRYYKKEGEGIMMKHEFEDLIGNPINDEEYDTIEYVYTWYPAISEIDGKAQIAKLYTDFGMPIIEDMVGRAGKMEKAERDLQLFRKELGVAQDRVNAVMDRIKALRGEKS
jgi:hypothetical protein